MIGGAFVTAHGPYSRKPSHEQGVTEVDVGQPEKADTEHALRHQAVPSKRSGHDKTIRLSPEQSNVRRQANSAVAVWEWAVTLSHKSSGCTEYAEQNRAFH